MKYDISITDGFLDYAAKLFVTEVRLISKRLSRSELPRSPTAYVTAESVARSGVDFAIELYLEKNVRLDGLKDLEFISLLFLAERLDEAAFALQRMKGRPIGDPDINKILREVLITHWTKEGAARRAKLDRA